MHDLIRWLVAFVVFFALFAFAADASAFDQPECAEDAVLVQDSVGSWVCGPSYDDQPIVEAGVYPNCDAPDFLIGFGNFAPDANGSYVWDGFACGYVVEQVQPQQLTTVVPSATVLPNTATTAP